MRPRRRSPGKELRVDLGDQRTSFFVRQNGSHLPIQALSPLSRMLVASRCIVRLNKNPTFYRARCVEAFPGLAWRERSTCRHEFVGGNFVIAGLERPVIKKVMENCLTKSVEGNSANPCVSTATRASSYLWTNSSPTHCSVAGSVEVGEFGTPPSRVT